MCTSNRKLQMASFPTVESKFIYFHLIEFLSYIRYCLNIQLGLSSIINLIVHQESKALFGTLILEKSGTKSPFLAPLPSSYILRQLEFDLICDPWCNLHQIENYFVVFTSDEAHPRNQYVSFLRIMLAQAFLQLPTNSNIRMSAEKLKRT